ncbi:WD repeat-containing protein 73 [Hyperolius riggenbachi]|uniref:WD repeat-containing protein 73 n=1 Tax=Hyperolius riggenbachi TaxID=752182 RepID=UPI0035A34802
MDSDSDSELGAERWMVETIGMYKDLHEFDLQYPTRVTEWIGEKSVCVAGYDASKTNEIVQLVVPQKLLVSENQGLCAERDLKVECGGFTKQPVYSLKHVSQQVGLILTSSPGSPEVQVWQMGAEDHGAIKPISCLQSEANKDTWIKIAARDTSSPQALHGSQINNVHLTEIESKKRIYTLAVESSEGVGSLSFLDVNSFLLCSLRGRLVLADLRQPGVASEGSLSPALPCSGHWVASARPGHEDMRASIASLSSEGHIAVTDSRNLANPLKCAKQNFPETSKSEDFLCICWAPKLEDCISVSGLDGTVQIYNTQSWDQTLAEKEALFSHTGHSVMGECEDGSEPRVTCHSWHPWKERTLISAANDGSLHMWDWLDRDNQRP